MHLFLDDFKNNQPLGCSDNLNLVGLNIFKKKLEKHFFAQVDVREYLTDSSNVELVIEVRGAISFALAVDHFRIDVLSNPSANAKFLMNCLLELQKFNKESIDIKEISFLLSDTSIFIQRVCGFSIVNQLDNIMRVLMNEYNYIISQIKDVPTEIHIPVLENAGNKDDNLALLPDFPTRTTARDYFTYWGLDFDSVKETVIYDVEKSSFIFEELSYLYD